MFNDTFYVTSETYISLFISKFSLKNICKTADNYYPMPLVKN